MTINFPTTVDGLRTALLEAGDDPATVAAMKKGELKERLLELTREDLDLQLEAIEDDSPPVETLERAIGIKYGYNKEWNDYILGLLDEAETFDGYPKVNGLSRLVDILGDVISSKATQVIVTHGENRCVTVNYEIQIEWKLNTPVGFGNLNFTPQIRTFGGVADAEYDRSNTFMKHAAALAETKAYGRALRKALAVSTIAAEEMLAGDSEGLPKAKDSATITPPLKSVIQAKALGLNLNLDEVIKEWNKGEYIALENLTVQGGRDLFTFINKYQQGK